MPDHIYKILELTGTSEDSIEGAVNNAVARASTTVRDLKWFEVSEVRGGIEDNKVAHWQVTMKVGFLLGD